jgi:hypothetical protein
LITAFALHSKVRKKEKVMVARIKYPIDFLELDNLVAELLGWRSCNIGVLCYCYQTSEDKDKMMCRVAERQEMNI